MWCHEAELHRAMTSNETVDPYISYTAFNIQIEEMQTIIDDTRSTLETSVDFDEYHVHTWGEQIVESFLTPPIARVAREWSMSVEEVEAVVADLSMETKEHEEYPEWGEVLVRADVDAAAVAILGWTALPTLNSARELEAGTAEWAELAAELTPCLP